MKTTKKKRRSANISPEEAMKQVQKIFKKRGSKALEMARKEILKEEIECKEAREALTYFMTEYWNDLARPTLLSLACEAVGGDSELTTPIAVSMILISGAIDIHDDIIDKSKTKSGRSTVYGKFGQDIALIVGDMLLVKGLTLLNKAVEKDISPERMIAISNIIGKMFLELGDAEALELQLRGRMDVTPEEYLHVVKKKAADVEAHTRVSAVLGGGSPEEIAALSEYGRLLGMLIILRDDWIDILDSKELRHRIRRECLPLPVLYALQEPKVKKKLSLISFGETITKKKVELLLKEIYDTEAIRLYEKLMNRLVRKADIVSENLKHETYYLRLLGKSTLPLIEVQEK